VRTLLCVAGLVLAMFIPAAAHARPADLGARAPIATAATVFSNCGGKSSTPMAALGKWQDLGVMSDGAKLIRKGGFSSTDFPSVEELVRLRGVSAPLAHATVVPNTHCGGHRMKAFGKRKRPKAYPMGVILPDGLSKGDLCKHVSKDCKAVTVTAYAFVQLLCDNGTHIWVRVVLLVKVRHNAPKPHPTPTPTPVPTATPAPSATRRRRSRRSRLRRARSSSTATT
jgi:hypothetical protein